MVNGDKDGKSGQRVVGKQEETKFYVALSLQINHDTRLSHHTALGACSVRIPASKTCLFRSNVNAYKLLRGGGGGGRTSPWNFTGNFPKKTQEINIPFVVAYTDGNRMINGQTETNYFLNLRVLQRRNTARDNVQIIFMNFIYFFPRHILEILLRIFRNRTSKKKKTLLPLLLPK